METGNQNNENLHFLSIKEVVDHFFVNANNKEVESELWKWFVYAVSGKGLTLADLNNNDFELFIEYLPQLLAAVYKWGNQQKIVPAINMEEKYE